MANYTGWAKGRKWISKGEESKFVSSDEIENYLSNGWVLGHLNDKQKEQKKKWYNNGEVNLIVKEGDEIPDGFVLGMLKHEEGNYAKFRFKWYTNGVDQIRISESRGDIPPEGWWQGQSNSMAEKSRNAAKGKHRTEEQKEHHKIGAEKAWKIKLQKGNYNTSSEEEKYLRYLQDKYGVDNVLTQYKDENRYPWHCDFYVISEDLFIELNKFPTHYTEPFDETNEEHIKLLEHCKTEPKNWVEKRMVDVWANYDVKKRSWAKEHSLNFLEIY